MKLFEQALRRLCIRAEILSASFEYIQAKRSFEGAITAARSVGWSDEEIAEATGLSLALVQIVSPPHSPDLPR